MPNNTGEVRIVGAPPDAQVYADQRLLGVVADFEGLDRHLLLPAGSHHIEIRASGTPPLTYDVTVRAGQRLSLQANVK
jgi:hypothetical protein